MRDQNNPQSKLQELQAELRPYIIHSLPSAYYLRKLADSPASRIRAFAEPLNNDEPESVYLKIIISLADHPQRPQVLHLVGEIIREAFSDTRK